MKRLCKWFAQTTKIGSEQKVK